MSNEASLPEVSTSRELALDRSQRVSRALQDAARKARLRVRKSSALAQPSFSRQNRASRLFALVSALVLFVTPSLIATVYFGFIAADQFQVESQISVHGGEMLPLDTVGLLTGIPSISQAQDGLIVTNYIESRALVDKLQSQIDLRAVFSRPEADFAIRLDPQAPIEELVRFWKARIFTSIDPQSGIITMRFRAFRREDAVTIANAVLADCEELVNEIGRRSRQDLVAKVSEEMVRAERRLVEVRTQFRQLRDQDSTIDPIKSAEAVGKLVSELKLDKLKAESELQVNGRSLDQTAPQMQVLKARRDALGRQIDVLEKTVTATTQGSGPTLSQSFANFDKARLEQEWAETYYKTVATMFERAKLENERQQVYLDTFVKPVLPEEAEFPRRFWNVLLVTGGSALFWVIVTYMRSRMKS